MGDSSFKLEMLESGLRNKKRQSVHHLNWSSITLELLMPSKGAELGGDWYRISTRFCVPLRYQKYG